MLDKKKGKIWGFSTHFEKYLFGHNSGCMNIKSILSPLK